MANRLEFSTLDLNALKDIADRYVASPRRLLGMKDYAAGDDVPEHLAIMTGGISFTFKVDCTVREYAGDEFVIIPKVTPPKGVAVLSIDGGGGSPHIAMKNTMIIMPEDLIEADA